MTNLSAMPDKVDMQRVHPFGRRHLRKGEMCPIGIHFWPDQAEATGCTVYMRINRHDGTIEVEHEHTRCCLGSHPLDTTKIFPGFFRRAFCQFFIEIV